MLAVSEIFGPTFQGEGPSVGQQANFLRMALCNLKCTWCDTPYTWDWDGQNGRTYYKDQEITTMTPYEAWVAIASVKPATARILVITGGEPLLQERGLADMLAYGIPHGYDRIEVETNGTLAPKSEMRRYGSVFYNVSPKLANSDNPLAKRLRYDALEAFATLDYRARFKFVITAPQDLNEVDKLVQQLGIKPERVWAMAEGTRPGIQQLVGIDVADEVLARGYNFSPRLHVMLWGDQRGK